MRKFISRIWMFVRRYWMPFAAGFGAAILAYLTINAISAPLSTSEFCGTACHEMDPAYQDWKSSPHYANINGHRAECIDCHLPPQEQFIRHTAAKAWTGAKDAWIHYFGPDYDREAVRQKIFDKMQDKTCLHCHKDLLAMPSGAAARIAHRQSLFPAEGIEFRRCVECHTVHAPRVE